MDRKLNDLSRRAINGMKERRIGGCSSRRLTRFQPPDILYFITGSYSRDSSTTRHFWMHNVRTYTRATAMPRRSICSEAWKCYGEPTLRPMEKRVCALRCVSLAKCVSASASFNSKEKLVSDALARLLMINNL
jgi:hypothetical protein